MGEMNNNALSGQKLVK